MTFRPAARNARPVSVISTTQSAMSGIFASVAPYERRTSASTPVSSEVAAGDLGVLGLDADAVGEVAHRRCGRVAGHRDDHADRASVALEYLSSPRLSTVLPVSSTQSRPVMPRSNNPSAT